MTIQPLLCPFVPWSTTLATTPPPSRIRKPVPISSAINGVIIWFSYCLLKSFCCFYCSMPTFYCRIRVIRQIRFKRLVNLPLVLDFVWVFPKTYGQSGEIGSADSCCLRDLRSNHLGLQDV